MVGIEGIEKLVYIIISFPCQINKCELHVCSVNMGNFSSQLSQFVKGVAKAGIIRAELTEQLWQLNN